MQLLCVYEIELDHTHLGMQLFCIHGTQFQVLVNLCTVAERCTLSSSRDRSGT